MIAALQSKALQCAQERPVSAVTLRAMMPQLESDARAERILSGLADDGHLKRIRRSGRTFYADPEFGQIVPEVKKAIAATSQKPKREKVSRYSHDDRVMEVLERVELISAAEIGNAVLPHMMATPKTRGQAIWKVNRWLTRYIKNGIVNRVGSSRMNYRYELAKNRSDNA